MDFNNKDTIALNAIQNNAVVMCDRSNCGRIKVSDDDRLRFLHNQSTNNFQILSPGQGCDTVFVTSTARTIDLVTAYILSDSVLLLVSPGYAEKLIKLMDKFIFFADKVKLTDISNETVTLSLIGAESDMIIEKLGGKEIIGKDYANHQLITWENIEIIIAVGSGLALPGYTLILNKKDADKLTEMLLQNNVIFMSETLWERLRIQQGRPIPQQELTEDYNPLEARLWQTISLTKGCYIGQETIARLNTYKGVKQQLWGIKLSGYVTLGTIITIDGEKVGKLTSLTETETGYFGLGYIRTKAGGEGLKVQLGEITGNVVNVPFLSDSPD